MKALADREVWFVTGSQHLYGADVLQLVEDHSRQIAGALDASAAIPVRVVSKPVVTNSESILALCLAATTSPNCVGVIAWMHTFSPARMWIAGLQALQKPLLHLHTQFNRGLPWGEIDMDFMNLNQSAHGDREFGYLETRLRHSRATVVGHWQDPEVLDRIGTWSRAACGWQEVHRLRLARFGDNMRQVAVTEGDKVEAQIRLGVQVDGYGLSDLVSSVRAAPDDAVDRVVEEYESRYTLAPALRAGGKQRAALSEAARIEVGLRAFLEAGGFRAFTDTFEDLGELAQLPGIAVQRLMADGYGFGAEGDWKTALLVRAMKVMATGLPGGTSFMEDYTYHLVPDRPQVLGAHMLEVCPSISAETPSCEIHPLSIGGKADPVRLVFTASPGPAVAVGLLDMGERFRLILNEVDVVSPPADLPRLPIARALWEPRPSLKVAAETWLLAGGPHHTSFSTALRREHLEDFAEMAGIELVTIGDGSSVAEIKKELRWSQAYYQLARGL
ncbi:MAG TPA: L-arabinose isomerase [Candidatus Limnocylindrales bacterium]|jgi:L-arabinose isomerase